MRGHHRARRSLSGRELPAARRQGAGQAVFRRQRRLRRQCGGRDRAARRSGGARRPARRPRRRGRQRRSRAGRARARAASTAAAASAFAGMRDGAVGDLHRRPRRPHDRDLPRCPHRRRHAHGPRRPRCLRRCAARRQPVSRFRAADLRGGAGARHDRGARRRPADVSVRRAVPDRHPRGVFRRVPARHHRVSTTSAPRSPASPARRGAFLAVTDGPDDVLWLDGDARCSGARSSPSRRSTRWAPAMCSTAPSRSRSPKAATSSTPCVLPLPRPGSNARASAAAPARRRAMRSTRSWREVSPRPPRSHRAAPDCRPGSSCGRPHPAPTSAAD